MGGFVLRDGLVQRPPLEKSQNQAVGPLVPSKFKDQHHNADEVSADKKIQNSEVLDSPMRDQTRYNLDSDVADEESQDLPLPAAINSAQLCCFLDTGLISNLSLISQAEIEDNSKGDFFVKGGAVTQVLWLIIQIITRTAEGLPSTQLEIAVLAFSVCTFITYLLWMKKPQDVGVPSYIYTRRHFTPEEKRILLDFNGKSFFRANLFAESHYPPSPTISNDIYTQEAKSWETRAINNWTYSFQVEDIGFILGAVVFGAVHCIAWNFHFPSSVEKTLWRVAAVITTTIMSVEFLLLLFTWRGGFMRVVYKPMAFITVSLYVMGRLYIMVEIFRSLFFLPPGAFVATWSDSFPHVS
jgi:hypothetical protein